MIVLTVIMKIKTLNSLNFVYVALFNVLHAQVVQIAPLVYSNKLKN